MDGGAVTLDRATHTYTRHDGARIPGVTGILEDCGFYDFPFASPEDLAYKKRLGGDVHRAAELLDRGTLDWSTVSDEVAAYLAGYTRFRAEHPGRVLANESLVYHSVLGYAGTLDRILELGRYARATLVDLKIGVPLPAHKMQTAAYVAAWNYTRKPVIHDRISLHLRGNGSYHFVLHTGADDLGAFCACLKLHRWKERHAPK